MGTLFQIKSCPVLRNSEVGGFRLQALANERFDLLPQVGIAFGVHVSGNEGALKPGHPVAFHRCPFVIKQIVAQNLRSRVVGGSNDWSAMHKAVWLVEVRSGGYIRGDDTILFPRLGYAVDLHGQQYRNADTIQIAGEHNNSGASPTLTEENDACPSFLLFVQDAIMIAVEKMHDRFVRKFPVPILKHLDVRAGWKILLQETRQDYRSVMRIVVAHKTTNKPDEDIRGCGCRSRGHGAVLSAHAWKKRCKQHGSHEQKSRSSNGMHANLFTY